MRGVKLTVAVLTILKGIALVISGAAFILFGIMGEKLGFYNTAFDLIAEFGFGSIIDLLKSLALYLGIIQAGLGLLYLILGAKFCSHKPNKGVAIILLIFSLISVLVLLLTIIYLILLRKRSQDYQNENF